MWQSIKRAKFLSKYNSPHQDEGDIVRVHLWLQKNRWPANEMVDAFMEYTKLSGVSNPVFDLNMFLTMQYDFVRGGDPVAWDFLCESWLNNDGFRSCMSYELKNFFERNFQS